MQRLSVRFEGRVQGVGFRATVAHVAGSFAVTGRVSNVSDGTVDLQADGEEVELLGFQQAIRQRLGRHITDCHEQWSEVSHSQWSDFGVGHDLLR